MNPHWKMALKGLPGLILGLSVLCLLLMLTVDRAVIDGLRTHQPDWLYHGFGHITRWGDATRYYTALSVTFLLSQCALWLNHAQSISSRLMIFLKRVRNWSVLILIGLITSGLLVNALKITLGRHRPVHWIREGVYGFEPFHGLMHNVNSFPSGHSQVAGCLTMALCLLAPRLSPLWVALGGLIMISRVIELDHYPSDVIAGALLGGLVMFSLYRLGQRRHWTL